MARTAHLSTLTPWKQFDLFPIAIFQNREKDCPAVIAYRWEDQRANYGLSLKVGVMKTTKSGEVKFHSYIKEKDFKEMFDLLFKALRWLGSTRHSRADLSDYKPGWPHWGGEYRIVRNNRSKTSSEISIKKLMLEAVSNVEQFEDSSVREKLLEIKERRASSRAYKAERKRRKEEYRRSVEEKLSANDETEPVLSNASIQNLVSQTLSRINDENE